MNSRPLPESLVPLEGEGMIRPFRVAAACPGAGRSWADAWRGLLWCEWFAHSQLVLVFLAAWLAIVWLLPLFADPGWVLLLGGLYALVAGPTYGGGDLMEGCEEFTLALPATRAERYVARLVVGGGTLLVLTAMDVLAMGLDLSQTLARLYVDTGLVQPMQVAHPGLLYGLVFALPFAAFAFSFGLAAVTRSRAQVFAASFWGALAALLVLRVAGHYEHAVWGQLNGLIACPLLMGLASAAVGVGYLGYQHKEVGAPVTPFHLPGRWWAWAALFLVGLAVALWLASWVAGQLPAALRPS